MYINQINNISRISSDKKKTIYNDTIVLSYNKSIKLSQNSIA